MEQNRQPREIDTCMQIPDFQVKWHWISGEKGQSLNSSSCLVGYHMRKISFGVYFTVHIKVYIYGYKHKLEGKYV
jgi:hypothetical protein